MKRNLLLLTMMFVGMFAFGCGGESLPPLDEVARVITVGDGALSAPAYGQNAVTLLLQNDDALFPEFAGLDLETRLPGVEVIRLERGGDSYHALAALDAPVCLCGAVCAEAGAACVDPGDERQALVIVALGVNDIFDAVVKLTLDFTLRDDPQPILDSLRADVAAVLGFFNDPQNFPTRPLIVVVSPVDPSDGVGDLGNIAVQYYPQLNPDIFTPELMNRVIGGFAQIVEEEADRAGTVFVDAAGHFLGHGYHYNDLSLPAYDGADPTKWVQHLFEPTLRGAHELRRVLWNGLVGEPVDALPGPVPAGIGEELPEVPELGWANAVVESGLTLEFPGDEGLTWINVADDPSVALGPPGVGTASAVAVGLTGAYVVFDLGEPALDGDGADLVVMELGALTGGAPEPYRVFVAEAAEGPFVPVADGRGERAFDLAGVGVAGARYVRIESQAHRADVLSGFGSPLYPGPEINAVGAVYPGVP